jgi:hypothetical protein
MRKTLEYLPYRVEIAGTKLEGILAVDLVLRCYKI